MSYLGIHYVRSSHFAKKSLHGGLRVADREIRIHENCAILSCIKSNYLRMADADARSNGYTVKYADKGELTFR